MSVQRLVVYHPPSAASSGLGEKSAWTHDVPERLPFLQSKGRLGECRVTDHITGSLQDHNRRIALSLKC